MSKSSTTNEWLKGLEELKQDFYFKTSVERYFGKLQYDKYIRYVASEGIYVSFDKVTKEYDGKCATKELNEYSRTSIINKFFFKDLITVTKEEFNKEFKSICFTNHYY